MTDLGAFFLSSLILLDLKLLRFDFFYEVGLINQLADR